MELPPDTVKPTEDLASGGRESPEREPSPTPVDSLDSEPTPPLPSTTSGDSRPPLAASTEALSLDDSPSPPPQAPPHHDHHFGHRLLRTVIAFLILFLVLRLLAVEPFGVPTGSMAPTLIGNHRAGPCPRCGHTVRIGDPGPGERAGVFEDAYCPNCGQTKIDLSGARDINGDRLLVDKNIFNLRSPRRWEVAVFRCPVDDSKPYVKRVVGLPNEVITIRDGDVYADGELLRKGLAEVRETRQPFFNLSHAPSPNGWSNRWLVMPPNADPRLPADGTPLPRQPAPAGASILHDGALHLDAAQPGQMVALTYRHTKVDENDREAEVRAWNSYNGPPRRASRTQAVHDFALTCDIAVQSGDDGLFSCRLYDGADSVTLDLSVGTKPPGTATLIRERHGGIGSVRHQGLQPGRTYRLEFAFIDRRVTAALDGRELLPPADLPAVEDRDEVERPLQIGARGCNVVVTNLVLYHDIHYSHGSQTDVKSWPLKEREYFVLGDNTTNSQDSREWRNDDPDPVTGKHEPLPGVTEAAFLGKPFFIHQPLRLGRTTIGGQERVFQTIDWSRLRWLH